MNALRQQERGARVAQVVNPHRLQFGGVQNGRKFLLTFRSSRGVPMVLVKTSPESFHAPPAFSCSSPLTRERSNRRFWQCHCAMPFALGLDKRQLLVDTLKGAPDPQCPLVEVDFVPS